MDSVLVEPLLPECTSGKIRQLGTGITYLRNLGRLRRVRIAAQCVLAAVRKEPGLATKGVLVVIRRGVLDFVSKGFPAPRFISFPLGLLRGLLWRGDQRPRSRGFCPEHGVLLILD
jgi:hypothetical protein